MRRYAVALLILATTLVACSKSKKHCWECHFSKGATTEMLDTNFCDKTEEESIAIQEKTSKRLIKDYGQPSSPPGSYCFKKSK